MYKEGAKNRNKRQEQQTAHGSYTYGFNEQEDTNFRL